MSGPQVTWLSAFLDLPVEEYAAAATFWSGVTGFPLSPPRGAYDEFASLLPPEGDDYLRLQRIAEGEPGIHLDLSVADARAAAGEAQARGARLDADHGTHLSLRSPGGLVFCFVSHGGRDRPPARRWPDGQHSGVYQVCLDLPRETYDAEAGFWAAILDANREVLQARPEFEWLRGSQQLALDVLLQRLDEPDGPVRAHLDLGTDDRPAEVRRHLALGADHVEDEQFWTVMRDPAGTPYCITDRDPATGRLAASQIN